MANTTLQVFNRASARVDNELFSIGSCEIPVNVAVTGVKYDQTFSIANGANTQIFNAQLSAFKYLFVASDFTVRLLISDDNGNTYSTFSRGTGTDNKLNLGFMLSTDDTTNTSSVVNSVTCFNSSGNSARVRIVAIN